MGLVQQYEKSGNVLFKYRGQIPALIFAASVPVVLFTNQGLYVRLAMGGLRGLHVFMAVAGVSVSIAGLALRAFTVGTTPKGTSGRNTQKQVADVLNTDGIYSVVRHPLYLANYLIWAGLLLFSMNIWAFLIVSMAYWLYYERIMFAEEAFLRKRFGRLFDDWAAAVPAIVPRCSLWRKGAMPFSPKTVLRREYATWFSTVLAFVLMDYVLFLAAAARFHAVAALPARAWIRPSLYVLSATAVLVLTLRFLKHHSRLLKKDSTRD